MTPALRLYGPRAQWRCEYCHVSVHAYPAPFQVDHIIARQHGGPDTEDNIALACLHCNRYKGPNIAGFDHETGAIVRLFHPRRDTWTDHLRWTGQIFIGLTAIGRVTVAVLNMNDPHLLLAKRETIDF